MSACHSYMTENLTLPFNKLAFRGLEELFVLAPSFFTANDLFFFYRDVILPILMCIKCMGSFNPIHKLVWKVLRSINHSSDSISCIFAFLLRLLPNSLAVHFLRRFRKSRFQSNFLMHPKHSVAVEPNQSSSASSKLRNRISSLH